MRFNCSIVIHINFTVATPDSIIVQHQIVCFNHPWYSSEINNLPLNLSFKDLKKCFVLSLSISIFPDKSPL